MPPSEPALSRKAIGWALIGQAIWLPLVPIAVHERWFSQQVEASSGADRAAGHGQGMAPPLSLRDVVQGSPSTSPQPNAGPTPPLVLAVPTEHAPASVAAAVREGVVLRRPAGVPSLQSATASAGSPAPSVTPSTRPSPGTRAPAVSGPPRSSQQISPSQLLGGSLALQDLRAGRQAPIPPLLEGARSLGAGRSAESERGGSSPPASRGTGSAAPFSGREASPGRQRGTGQAAD